MIGGNRDEHEISFTSSFGTRPWYIQASLSQSFVSILFSTIFEVQTSSLFEAYHPTDPTSPRASSPCIRQTRALKSGSGVLTSSRAARVLGIRTVRPPMALSHGTAVVPRWHWTLRGVELLHQPQKIGRRPTDPDEGRRTPVRHGADRRGGRMGATRCELNKRTVSISCDWYIECNIDGILDDSGTGV